MISLQISVYYAMWPTGTALLYVRRSVCPSVPRGFPACFSCGARDRAQQAERLQIENSKKLLHHLGPSSELTRSIHILDAVPPIHVVSNSNHVATDKLTTQNDGMFTN